MIASPSRPRRLAALTGLAAVLAATTGTAAAARTAAARPPRHTAISGHTLAAATLAAHRPAAGATQQVELALTPRDRGGLASLAAAHGLTRRARLARLDVVLPGRARGEQVAAVVRRLGLTVTGSTALTLTASGPAATVASLFGTEQATGLPTAQALPRVPAALNGLVTVAYGGDDTRPAELPLGLTTSSDTSRQALTVAQTRSLYGTTATTAAPTSGAPIVATLQFTTAGVVGQAIDNADSFATANSLYVSGYHPSTNMTQVAVDPRCVQDAGDDDGDEVALDTQTLLATAPQLRQRIYQVDNCGDAQDDAIAQIVADVQAGMPIVALSTSWGECEEDQYGSTTADVDAVNTLLAAGVTMFAASGDDGADDCNVHPGADAVDTPAVLPGVVAVGGTTGTTGSTETAWYDGPGYDTGGGFSCGFFARPAYQATVAKPASYPHNGFGCPTGASERMVPDISANGGNGLRTVVTDSAGTSTQTVFGTSFSAPLAAGGFAETLMHLGITTTGLGDIHAYLYADRGFFDVRQGSNGEYAAGSGYDLATGLGTPAWPTVLTSVRDLGDVSVSATGVIQIRSALADARWRQTTGIIATPLTVSDASQWEFILAPYADDASADLWAVQLAGTSSGHIEVHVLSQRTGYQTQLATITLTVPTVVPADFQVRVAPFAGDKASDLYLIKTAATASGKVEVQALSAASGYQSSLVHVPTPLSGGPAWTFLVGDKAGSGDLVGVLDADGASGYTEVHVLSRSGDYRTFSLHARTPLRELGTDPYAQWSLDDVNGDGVPDVVLSLIGATGSGSVELHALAGPGDSTFALQTATALPTTASTDTVGLP